MDIKLAVDLPEGGVVSPSATDVLHSDALDESPPIAPATAAGAITRQDGTVLERAAHKLKGSLGNFGAHEAAQTAQELENGGRIGDFNQLQAACDQLEIQVETLNNALADLLNEEAPCAS